MLHSSVGCHNKDFFLDNKKDLVRKMVRNRDRGYFVRSNGKSVTEGHLGLPVCVNNPRCVQGGIDVGRSVFRQRSLVS